MEDIVHQWILMQHGQQQSVSDVDSLVTLNATAPMHLNPGKSMEYMTGMLCCHDIVP